MTKRILTIAVIFSLIALAVLFYIYKINHEPPTSVVRLALITDYKYITPTRALIKSISANKKRDTLVEINILGFDLHKNEIEALEKHSKHNLSVHVIKKTQKDILDLDGGNIVSRADNLKFFLADIFPDIDKILYLDGDTIVLDDLSELYNTDLGNNYAAATDDWQTSWVGINRKKRYFNNGVMLLNLAQMRKDNITNKLLDAKMKDTRNLFVTQDAFNTVMLGKVVYLPLIYDTFAPEYEKDIVLNRIRDVLKDNFDSKTYPYKTADEYRKHVVIIHYCGWNNQKPWYDFDFHRKVNRIWYRYAPFRYWQNLFEIALGGI